MNGSLFSGFFNGLFGEVNHPVHQQQNAARNNGKAPPASQNAIDRLPMVKVTADDLLEAANKECTVCLDEQKLGNYCVKLQCGHLFHKECLIDWLKLQCTCPVCRFEIETDDKSYEADRKARMKKRKLRFRIDELKSKSILQLKELCRALVVNIVNCIDKNEIIERLVSSGKIDITEGLPPLEMTREELMSKTVGELKHLLLSFGVSSVGAIEKSELRDVLLHSGRIVLIESVPNDSDSSTAKLTAQTESDVSQPTSNDMTYGEWVHQQQSGTSGSSSGLSPIDSQLSSAKERQQQIRYEEHMKGENNGNGSTVPSSSSYNCRMDPSTSITRANLSTHTRNKKTQHKQDVDCISVDSSDSDYFYGDKKFVDHIPNSFDLHCADDMKYSDESIFESAKGSIGQDKADLVNETIRNRANSKEYCDSLCADSKVTYSEDKYSGDEKQSSTVMDDDRGDRFILHMETLNDMSIGEIKSIMASYDIDSTGCLYRRDLITRLRECDKLYIMD